MSLSVAMRPNVSSVPKTTEQAASIVVVTVDRDGGAGGVQLDVGPLAAIVREVADRAGRGDGGGTLGSWAVAATGIAGTRASVARSERGGEHAGG